MEVHGLLGQCGDREVFLGFAAARDLVAYSFADVLDESTGHGYQRRFSKEHSLEFKRYIQTPGATSIPLTFNIRSDAPGWELVKGPGKSAVLRLPTQAAPVLVQVDGQHRLGFLQASPIEFAFMSFLGLSVEEEMDVFRVINGKARGLSNSLIDFTEARLIGADLPVVKPELYVALRLHEDPDSPWHKRLDLGGKTVGTKRIASLRTMQVAVRRLMRCAAWREAPPAHQIADITVAFWRAVQFVLPHAWAEPRHHVLVKGIGVYALMSFAGILVAEARQIGRKPDFDFFVAHLSDFTDRIDWTNAGPLHGYGGVAGADAALQMILQVRSSALDRYHSHA
jgi:DNA sulfur modification protein DndB